VNSAAIPDALFESEWFGYERGAFTGALIRTAGWMESSHRGTMFLDEIGDMSLFAQAKLLRVIESKEFHRLGGKKSVRVDVRFIAATNRNLEEMAGNGKFRQDLYYRLNIARVHLPPLRERREDIPPLLRHYMRELSLQNQNRITEMTDEVRNCLMEYDWPGNIRELKNVLESIFVNAPQGKIRLADLPEQFRNRLEKSASPGNDERQQLITALTRTQWNKSKAAEALRWSRMTLYRKMHKYRIYTPRSA
jgi:transcriptional regulator with PAS, ATPase and Fis domain